MGFMSAGISKQSLFESKVQILNGSGMDSLISLAPRHVCDLCHEVFNEQFKFFEHLKFHYEAQVETVKAEESVVSTKDESPKKACVKKRTEQCATNKGSELLITDFLVNSKSYGEESTAALKPNGKQKQLVCQTIKKETGTKGKGASSPKADHLKCSNCLKKFKTDRNLQKHTNSCQKTANSNLPTKKEGKNPCSLQQDSNPISVSESPDEFILDDVFDDDEEVEQMYLQGNICPSCDKTCDTKENLEEHIRLSHPDIDRVTKSLSVHSETVKNDESNTDLDVEERSQKNSLKCNMCSRVFGHRNSLIYHMRSHTGERPYKCEPCGKRFFATSALKVHLRIHSGERPYTCELCNRDFRQWGDLKYHKISIHSDVRAYQCEFCGKDFSRNYSLIIHRRIHTGERNYKCDFCSKCFRAASYLQKHRKIHTGEKPHSCHICGKQFRVRSDMKRHIISHSKNIKVATVIGAVSGLPDDFNEPAEIIPLVTDTDLVSPGNIPLLTAISSSRNLITDSSHGDPLTKGYITTEPKGVCVPVPISLLSTDETDHIVPACEAILSSPIFASTSFLTSAVAGLESENHHSDRMNVYQGGTTGNLESVDPSVANGAGDANAVVFMPLNSHFSI